MRRAEAVIRTLFGFVKSDLGKAAVGLFGAVLSFALPQVPGYAVGCFAVYYCIHQFRPVAGWIIGDITADLADPNASDPQ